MNDLHTFEDVVEWVKNSETFWTVVAFVVVVGAGLLFLGGGRR